MGPGLQTSLRLVRNGLIKLLLKSLFRFVNFDIFVFAILLLLPSTVLVFHDPELQYTRAEKNITCCFSRRVCATWVYPALTASISGVVPQVSLLSFIYTPSISNSSTAFVCPCSATSNKNIQYLANTNPW